MYDPKWNQLSETIIPKPQKTREDSMTDTNVSIITIYVKRVGYICLNKNINNNLCMGKWALLLLL